MKREWTIWFTGLHGSGKSTIAEKLAEILRRKGIPAIVLDGDELRNAISYDLGYSVRERDEHMKRVANLCGIISESGIVAIASVASPTEKSREYAKKILKKMFLVYVKCPLEICEKRDVKGHYRKAREKEKGFEHFIDVSSGYEEPKNPDISLYTDRKSVKQSVDKLIAKLEEKGVVRLK